ncbi:alpha/beta fold hydrolase [Chloroflexales bacterium ZM16-3]|nr:alpha/beta fold hydrolase [Chloroflexales bacterium ZM16-3]
MQSRYIHVQGYRLHYLEAGSGPVVLLLHGFGGSAEGWRATGDFLAGAGYRALAFDCLGFGRSDKPTDAPYSLELISGLYIEAMNDLGIDRAAIIAHSMGGKYALATALLHPDRVTGLSLVASDGFAPAAAMSKVGKWPLLCWSILWLSGQRPLVRAMMGAAFHQPEAFVTEEIIAHSSGAFQGWENIHALTALSQRYDATDLEISGMRARLRELRIPALLTWGENDQIFPVSQSAVAVAEIPDARLVTFPHCGHFPQIEAARPFRGVLLGFLASLAV